MNFSSNRFPGLCLVEPLHFPDARGSFSRLWCENEFELKSFPFKPEQLNFARSFEQGTIRGLHYQKAPHETAKLITCIKGSIYDVIIDLRPESPTYLQWHGITLSAESPRMLLIPAGVAHGYQTLEKDTDVLYMLDGCYNPSAESGIRWNDPRFQIGWKVTPEIIVSQRDERWQDFEELVHVNPLPSENISC